MTAFGQQLGAKDEVTFNTPLTVDRFWEYTGDAMPMALTAGRTEGNPLRTGSRARIQGRTVPYFDHAEGHIDFEMLSKGFGWWLKYMLPTVVSSGSGPFVYTATEGTTNPMGKSFTFQFNEPFSPTGTDQALTFSGGKVTKWSISNSVDQMLMVGLDLWAASFATATALATATYATSPAPFAWVHGVCTVGGAAFDITDFNIEVDLGLNVDRPQIRGSAVKKEPTPGPIGVTFSLEADFDTLTQFNRVHSSTIAGMSASVTGTWTNGTDIFAVTLPGARFDDVALGGDRGQATQTLTGVGEKVIGDATSPIQVAYTTADTTA